MEAGLAAPILGEKVLCPSHTHTPQTEGTQLVCWVCIHRLPAKKRRGPVSNQGQDIGQGLEALGDWNSLKDKALQGEKRKNKMEGLWEEIFCISPNKLTYLGLLDLADLFYLATLHIP